jgi:hypothetical protein
MNGGPDDGLDYALPDRIDCFACGFCDGPSPLHLLLDCVKLTLYSFQTRAIALNAGESWPSTDLCTVASTAYFVRSAFVCLTREQAFPPTDSEKGTENDPTGLFEQIGAVS